jgi:transcription antitermination factor NusG
MGTWHVWTINQQRYGRVKEFLENLREIEEFFYPTVIKEYSTKSGRKTKDIPLFSNYIFIKYEDSNLLHSRISDSPWIKDCLGKCSQKEMEEVLILSKKKYEDLVPTSEVQKGYSYKLIGTPFKDMTCTVVEIDGDKLVVAVELFGSDRLIKCSINDIALEG